MGSGGHTVVGVGHTFSGSLEAELAKRRAATNPIQVRPPVLDTLVKVLDTPVSVLDTPVYVLDTPVSVLDTPSVVLDTSLSVLHTPLAGRSRQSRPSDPIQVGERE